MDQFATYGTMLERFHRAKVVVFQRGKMAKQDERGYMSGKLDALKTPDECGTIEEIRDAIDEIDHEIVVAIGRRFEYVKAIMRFKSTADDVRAPQRYQEVLQRRRAWAVEAGLDADIIEQIYRDLIGYFIAHEMTALEAVGSGQATGANGTGQSDSEAARE